jgi:hypothetical protein
MLEREEDNSDKPLCYAYIRQYVFFPWHYNPLWLYFHSPVAGFSHLVFEVS